MHEMAAKIAATGAVLDGTLRRVIFLFSKNETESRSFARSPNQLVSVLAWIWTIGILAAYTHGFADIIRLLWKWLMRIGT